MTTDTPAPVPIVGVTGTVGKSTTATLLDRLVRAAGWSTALWLDDGVRIDGQAQSGELEPWSRALRGVTQGDIRLAIQELPAATVQAVGLPAGMYAVGVVTNLAMNEAVLAGTPQVAMQAAANRRVAAAVHHQGALVLNADDRAVADLAATAACPVVFWALRRASPPLARHLAAGGAGLYLADAALVWEQGDVRSVIGSPTAAPVTGGGLALFQVQNLLPAVATALALGLPAADVGRRLGRLDETDGLLDRLVSPRPGVNGRAIVASARGLLAFRALARLLGRLDGGAGRVIAAVAWPDGLEGGEAREIARTLARLCSLLFLHGSGAEVAAALVVEARPPDRLPAFCRAVESESEALRRLARLLTERDRLLLVGDRPAASLALFQSYVA
ncbi:MAG: hypothetical protein IT340_04625 [Chloroflexi bacterium]|nr:hypothetical protein [Chloroflexota bacterium]